VLREVGAAKTAIVPWWIGRLKADIERHLSRATHNGLPLIDTPMSAMACEAVLLETVNYLQRPRTAGELVAEVEADLREMEGKPA
jgi:hypothetical protein